MVRAGKAAERIRRTALRRRAGAGGQTRLCARLGKSADAAERGEEFGAGLQAQRAKQVVAVTIALVNGRRGGAGCFGHGTHGERLLAAAGPQSAGGGEDALFQLRIWLSGQRLSPCD